MAKSNTPKIRFKGFTDDWEQRKLGDLALFNPKDELPQTFEYVDLESVVGTEMLSHRTEAKVSAPSRAQRLARTGDLFYQTVRPYLKKQLSPLKSLIITMFFRLDMRRCVRLSMGIFCLVLFKANAL